MQTWVWSVVLLIVGLLIVGIEVFIPSGGLLGVLSALAVLGALVLGFMSGFKFGMVMLIVACILIPIVIMLALHWWPHTPIGRKIVIQPPKDEEVLPNLDEDRRLKELIGQRGVAKTTMLPSGIVEVEHQQFDAISDGAPIEVNQIVQVTAVKMRRLEVRLVEPDEAIQAPPPTAAAPPDDLLSRPIDSLGLEALDDPLA